MKLFNLIFLLLGVFNTSIAQVQIKNYTKYIASPSTSVISADGQYYYLEQGKGLGVYKINPTTKLLENIQEVKVDASPHELIITNDSRFIITANYSKGMLLIYKRNASDGKLSLHKSYVGSINGRGVLKKPTNLVLSPSGNYLFLRSDKLLITLRYEDGALTYLREHDSEAGSPGRVYFSPDNEHVFIERYHFDAVSNQTMLTFNEEDGTFNLEGSLREDFPIPNAYFDFFGEKRQYNVSPSFDYMAFSPDGKDVYTDATEMYPNGSRGAFMHYRWINGKLTLQKAYYELPPTFQIETLKNIYLDGSGDYFYVLTGGEASGIHVFKRNTTTGALTFVKSFHKKNNLPRIITPYRLSFSADNQHIYVSSYFGGNIITLENKDGKQSPKKSKPNNNSQPKPIVTNNFGKNSDNSNVQQSDCQHPQITTTEIARIEERLIDLETEQARYDYALKILQNRCLETVQVLRLARTFEVEYMRLELVKFAYYYTSDIENFYLLDTLFTNDRLKGTFNKLMEG
jgi:6-phosphogluconolactonase (cycloisomerase 2 family)